MKQDIRGLFRRQEFPKKKLPESHEEEFLEKLKKTKNKNTKKKKRVSFFKIAAVVLILFSIGVYFQKKNNQDATLEAQIEQIEKEYLKNIDKEWKAFINVTDDQNLIQKYKGKLQELDNSYKEISKQYKKNANNISILEGLIENLQRRLQLLKNIKEHVKELHQNNTSNETIYL